MDKLKRLFKTIQLYVNVNLKGFKMSYRTAEFVVDSKQDDCISFGSSSYTVFTDNENLPLQDHFYYKSLVSEDRDEKKVSLLKKMVADVTFDQYSYSTPDSGQWQYFMLRRGKQVLVIWLWVE